MKKMNLWVEPPKEEQDQITLAVTVEHANGKKDQLWYRLHKSHRDAIPSCADPLVLGSVFLMMSDAAQCKEPIEVMVHGIVSPSLIRNLEEFQLAWSIWRPKFYGRTVICAEEERETFEGPEEENAVMCFSGGLDSAFTAYRHARSGVMRFPRQLRAGVMVQGMEFNLEETPIYLRAEERARRMLESLGLPLIRITTNYREVIPLWWFSHGPAVASCLSLLQRRYNLGLIAQTMTYRNNHMVTEGVNPTTDWLMSSESMKIIPDGAGFERLEKMESLTEWPEFLTNMRVCWAGDNEKAENCCRCEKCVQTILHFRVLGLGLPQCFPEDVTNEHILSMDLKEVHMAMAYDNILARARENEVTDSWVNALDRCIKRNRRRHRSKIHYYSRRLMSKASTVLSR